MQLGSASGAITSLKNNRKLRRSYRLKFGVFNTNNSTVYPKESLGLSEETLLRLNKIENRRHLKNLAIGLTLVAIAFVMTLKVIA